MPLIRNPSGRKTLYVGRTLREGPKPLEDLCLFFYGAGYTVFMPYDLDVQSNAEEIKKRDMTALRYCDLVVLELRESSLGVAQELGAARALGKPVILIASSRSVTDHNWIRGDPEIKCCATKEQALELLRSY